MTTTAYQKMTPKCRLVPCCAFKLCFLQRSFILLKFCYLLKYKYYPKLFKQYFGYIFDRMFYQSQESVILPYCLVYVMFDVFTLWSKKDKNLLPGMYSCPKDEHIQELTMKPVSERNKIKQDMS